MRSVKDLIALLDDLGLPNVQIQWTPASAPDLPYVVIVPDSTSNRPADNRVNFSPVRYMVELYTRYRDMELEAQLQVAFHEAGIYYQRYTTVVPDGYAILTRYTMLLTEDAPEASA